MSHIPFQGASSTSSVWREQLGMPVVYDFSSAQFDDAVRAAGRKAFPEALAGGLAVF